MSTTTYAWRTFLRPTAEPETLDRSLRRRAEKALRRGEPLRLGSLERPLDLAADAASDAAAGFVHCLVDALAGCRGLDLRLTVSALHPDRDPRLLARLDEEHALGVDVVVAAADPADPAAVDAADLALTAAATLAERGLQVRIVTPMTPELDAHPERLAAVARSARHTGAADWRAVDPGRAPRRLVRRRAEPLWRVESRRLRLEMGMPRTAASRC